MLKKVMFSILNTVLKLFEKNNFLFHSIKSYFQLFIDTCKENVSGLVFFFRMHKKT